MIYEHYNLFEPGKYFPQCHAPYIIEMPNRSFIVSFFAGSKEKAKDVGSWLVKKPVVGGSWTEPSLFLKGDPEHRKSRIQGVPPVHESLIIVHKAPQVGSEGSQDLGGAGDEYPTGNQSLGYGYVSQSRKR